MPEYSLLAFSFYAIQDFSLWDDTTHGSGGSVDPVLETPSQIYPETGFLGDSRHCEVV